MLVSEMSVQVAPLKVDTAMQTDEWKLPSIQEPRPAISKESKAAKPNISLRSQELQTDLLKSSNADCQTESPASKLVNTSDVGLKTTQKSIEEQESSQRVLELERRVRELELDNKAYQAAISAHQKVPPTAELTSQLSFASLTEELSNLKAYMAQEKAGSDFKLKQQKMCINALEKENKHLNAIINNVLAILRDSGVETSSSNPLTVLIEAMDERALLKMEVDELRRTVDLQHKRIESLIDGIETNEAGFQTESFDHESSLDVLRLQIESLKKSGVTLDKNATGEPNDLLMKIDTAAISEDRLRKAFKAALIQLGDLVRSNKIIEEQYTRQRKVNDEMNSFVSMLAVAEDAKEFVLSYSYLNEENDRLATEINKWRTLYHSLEAFISIH